MSDTADTPAVKPDERDPDLLQYDFLKFLTTLAILVLGGVLSLNVGDSRMSREGLSIVILFVALAGVSAVTGADAIVKARALQQPLGRFARASRTVSMGLLGGGTGYFLAMWTQALG